jgi:hypothetical protein
MIFFLCFWAILTPGLIKSDHNAADGGMWSRLTFLHMANDHGTRGCTFAPADK